MFCCISSYCICEKSTSNLCLASCSALSQSDFIYRCNLCLYVQQCKEQNPQFRSFLGRQERQPSTKMMRSVWYRIVYLEINEQHLSVKTIKLITIFFSSLVSSFLQSINCRKSIANNQILFVTLPKGRNVNLTFNSQTRNISFPY